MCFTPPCVILICGRAAVSAKDIVCLPLSVQVISPVVCGAQEILVGLQKISRAKEGIAGVWKLVRGIVGQTALLAVEEMTVKGSARLGSISPRQEDIQATA